MTRLAARAEPYGSTLMTTRTASGARWAIPNGSGYLHLGGAADAWLQDNDPEGVAWEYEVEGGPVEGSVWLCLPDPASRAIGEPDWIKLFVSKECAQKWLEDNKPKRDIWQYPVQE